MLGPLNKVRQMTLQGNMPLGTMGNQDEVWEKVEYETAYDHMLEMLDQPMEYDPKDTEEHYFVDLNLKKHWDNMRGWAERKWDQVFDTQYGEYWEKTAPKRIKMVAERNEAIKNHQLSFRACGNGMGAPRCNQNGEQIHMFYKGKRVPMPGGGPHGGPMYRGRGKGGFLKGKGKMKFKRRQEA